MSGPSRVSPGAFLAAVTLLAAGCSSPQGSDPPPPGEKLERESVEVNSRIAALDFSEDSKYLAALCENGDVIRWDVRRGETIGKTSLPAENHRAFNLGTIRRFAVAATRVVEVPIAGESPGRSAASAGFDPSRVEMHPSLQVWDAEDGLVKRIPLEQGASFILFDQTAERVAAPGEDGAVTLWNARDGSFLERLQLDPPGGISRLAPGASFGLLCYLKGGKIRIRSLNAGGMDTVLQFPRDASVDLALSGDSRTLASLNADGAVEIRALPDGEILARVDDFEKTPRSLALSRDGSVLAVNSGDARIDLRESRSGELLDQQESTFWAEGGVHFSPDGHVLAWVEKERMNVRFWSPVEDVTVWKPTGPEPVESARSICPDLASLIRFRRARAPFERALAQLKDDALEEARRSFASARRIFPSYPGLAAAAADAEERYQSRVAAEVLRTETTDLESRGKYLEALEALDVYLRKFAGHDRYGFSERAETIRAALKHLELAATHRESGREIASIEEFVRAAALVPELSRFHPGYATLRDRLISRITREATLAFQAQDHEKTLRLYDDLKRLRPLGPAELLRLGESHLGLGQPTRAREALESIAQGPPEYATARRRLADIARDSGDLRGAREELERARAAAPGQLAIETEYAEICELLGDLDEAVETWEGIGRLEPESADSQERIGSIEESRKRWKEAGESYRSAIRRSTGPRPRLLMKVAEAYGHSGDSELVLQAYVDLLAIVRDGVQVPWLGDRPEKRIRKWIRDLGYVHHRGEWIAREQFLAEQGWMHRLEGWMRPEEVQLREVVSRTRRDSKDLRAAPQERYARLAAEKTIVKGMNRREVIEAWGFFEDQNVLELEDGETVYEQLLFERGRKVYLRNGVVCFWTE